MDIVSHGLYSAIAFGRKGGKDYVTAFLFGIGPDILAFGPFFFALLLGFSSWPAGTFEPPNFPVVPRYIYSLYNISHSLIIYAVFFAAVWLAGKKRFAALTLGWPLHILLDMPTHSAAFFPTPFMWPLFNIKINGIPWSEPVIFFPNVILVVSLYIYWYFKGRTKKLV